MPALSSEARVDVVGSNRRRRFRATPELAHAEDEIRGCRVPSFLRRGAGFDLALLNPLSRISFISFPKGEQNSVARQYAHTHSPLTSP